MDAARRCCALLRLSRRPPPFDSTTTTRESVRRPSRGEMFSPNQFHNSIRQDGLCIGRVLAPCSYRGELGPSPRLSTRGPRGPGGPVASHPRRAAAGQEGVRPFSPLAAIGCHRRTRHLVTRESQTGRRAGLGGPQGAAKPPCRQRAPFRYSRSPTAFTSVHI